MFVQYKHIKQSLEDGIYSEADVIFTTSSSVHKGDLKGFWFHRVIIDEAGLETDEMRVGTTTKRCCNLVACGDPHQLPPTCDELARQYGYDIALYSRACAGAEQI